MGIGYKAITATVPLVKDNSPKVEARLKRFHGDAVRFLAKYPPSQSKTGYQRTGTLGRNWQGRYIHEGGNVGVIVSNATDYAEFVQGSDALGERVSWARPYGWPSIDDLESRWQEARDEIDSLLAGH